MAITRSQIARQLLAEGGVSLDDAKAMAPEGEFLAYINPKEAEMLKDAGGSGIMTPLGIPSFVDFGAGPGSVSESLSEAAGLSGPSGGGGGGNGDGGGNFSTITKGPKGPPTVGDGGSGQYITKNPYGKPVTNLGRRSAAFFTGMINPAVGYTVNQQLKEEQQKQKDLLNAIQGGQQFFGTTPRSLTTAYKETTGMKTGPSGPPGGGDGGGDLPIIPKIPQVATLPTDIETPSSDSEKQFDVRFFLDPRFEAKDGGEVSVDDAEKMAPPGESLAYINDDEAALLKALGGAGEAVNQTGIPSYFIKKVFKKAKKAVKKIVKSDLGKAALAGAALYYGGGGNLFGLQRAGMSKFAFGNLPGAGAVSNFFSGGGGNKLSLFNKAKSFLGDNAGAALGIGAASIAGGLMSGKQEEETDTIASRISKETGLPIAQIRKEVQEATAKGQEALDELSVKYPFLQRAETALVKDGGRIRKEEGGIMMASNIENDRILEDLFEKYLDMGLSPKEAEKTARDEFDRMSKKQGNKRTMAANGGIMDLGGMEMDLRGGGFVPLGAKEKADDVPARLSKNEFVFTADAVRAAGGGSVDKGADLMYKTMKQLEDRVA
jgi:hypothetical protein